MKRAISFFLTIALVTALGVNAFAARSTEQIKKEQAESQRNLAAAEEEASDIQSEKSMTEEELEENKEQLARVITSVSIIEDEIKAKDVAVDEAEKQYEEAKKKEEAQYKAMKRRIRYLYEHGGTNAYAEFFSGGSSFADILNRSAYAEEIYEYDRSLLEDYQEAKKRVKESEEKLQQELDELTEIKNTYEEESDALEQTIAEQKEKVEDFDNQLASARAKASQYKNQIAAQNKEIRDIAEAEAKAAAAKKKAEEEARKKAEAEAKKKAEKEAKKKAEEGRNEDSGDQEEEYAPEEEGEYEEEEKEEKKSDSGGSGIGSQIASYAQQFLGNPYVSGGTSLTDGADCSGFTQAVYSHFGYSIPRTSWEQQSAGRGVSYSDAQPGDIFCYSGHVGIYIGNNTICHASTPETGIKLTPATYRDIITIRRIV
ncbi:MAG: C40 family peptidase [Lachnospiraceae bacterium]|nr:C40 family peptidase [Lachnospiraceae bacterium]